MKIEFFSAVDGLSQTYPIIESKKNMPKWMYTARKAFSEAQDKRDLTITKCPGIVEILTKGFVVTAWHDIDVNSEDQGLTGSTPSEELNTLLGNPVIQVQSGEGIGKFLPRRPWSNKDILKINTPWHIKSDIKFLMIPLPYTEEFEFESCTGILDPSVSSEINVQGYVNGRGKFTIKAGQPLCQLIPLTDDSYDFEVRDANEDDRKWLKTRKYLNNSSFSLNKNILRSAYNRFIQSFRATK